MAGTSQPRILFPLTNATDLRGALRTMVVELTCRCRCDCHAGVCSRTIDLETLDCDAGCRGQRSILDADCNLNGGSQLTPATIESEVVR